MRIDRDPSASNYGLLRFTGRDLAGEVQVLELEGHPFFLATLFQPERSALRGQVHSLIREFVRFIFESHPADA